MARTSPRAHVQGAMHPEAIQFLDLDDGTLGDLPGGPPIGPGLTLGDFEASSLGAQAVEAEADERVLALRVELGADEWLPEPAALTLEFHETALERVWLQALEPPIPTNPRWRRREDEEVRDLRHGVWLRKHRIVPGWFRWGELVSGYNSAREVSAIRLRYSIAGRPWPLSGARAFASSWPTPAEALNSTNGELLVGGAVDRLGPSTTERAFLDSTLGARSRETSPGARRVELAPGELFQDAGSLLLRFDGGRLRELRFFPVSERFGTGWDDFGPEEASAVQDALRDWLAAALDDDSLDAPWGRAALRVDAHGGTCAVHVEYV